MQEVSAQPEVTFEMPDVGFDRGPPADRQGWATLAFIEGLELRPVDTSGELVQRLSTSSIAARSGSRNWSWGVVSASGFIVLICRKSDHLGRFSYNRLRRSSLPLPALRFPFNFVRCPTIAPWQQPGVAARRRARAAYLRRRRLRARDVAR